MANAHFAKGKQAILSAEINYLTATFKAVLVRNDYPQNLAVDEFLSDISAYVLGTAVALTGVSITDGIFDANDAVFPLVPAGDTAEGVQAAALHRSDHQLPGCHHRRQHHGSVG
jgi:hypothetical protein